MFPPFASASDPKEEEALFVAQKAFDDGFYDLALSLLDRFGKSYSASGRMAEVSLLVAQCYFHKNMFLEALQKLDEAERQPGEKNIRDAILYWKAEVNFRGNNFSKAAQQYRSLIELYPSSRYAASAGYSLGWSQFQERLFQEALETFSGLQERFPGNAYEQEAAFKIIECLYNLKRYAELKEKIKSFSGSTGTDSAKQAYLHFYRAEAEYYLGDFEEAAQWYEKTMEASVDSRLESLARLSQGWALIKLKRFDSAQQAFADVRQEMLEKSGQESLLLGKAFLSQETGRFDEALSAYETLTGSADQGTLVQALLGKAETLYANERYKLAVEEYGKALERSATMAGEITDRIHYGLAWAFLKDGRFKEAIGEFQKLAKQSEDRIFKVSALCQIGDAYQDSGDLKQALETYRKILNEYPDNLYGDYVQYQLGITHLKAGSYDEAIMTLMKLRERFPDSKLVDDAHYATGLAYFQKQDYAASKELFKDFRSRYRDLPLNAQAVYLLATSMYNLGEFEQAIEIFKDIIRSSQDASLIQKAEYEIADCYYRMGNEKEAMARFNNLRAKYPDSLLTAEIMWWMGEYYYRQDELSQARRYFSSLISDFPSSPLVPDAHYALGTIYAEEGKNEEALESFSSVLKITSSDLAGQAAVAIADIYLKQKEFDRAAVIYRDKLSQYPNLSHLIYPKLGELCAEQGNHDQALEHYRASLKFMPARETGQILFRIGEILQLKGDNDGAVEEYLKVSYLYGENKQLGAKALLRIAAIMEGQDKKKEAAGFYRKLAELDVPEAEFAREQLKALATGQGTDR